MLSVIERGEAAIRRNLVKKPTTGVATASAVRAVQCAAMPAWTVDWWTEDHRGGVCR